VVGTTTTVLLLLLLLLVRGEFSIRPYICQFIFYLSIQQGIHITTYAIPAARRSSISARRLPSHLTYGKEEEGGGVVVIVVVVVVVVVVIVVVVEVEGRGERGMGSIRGGYDYYSTTTTTLLLLLLVRGEFSIHPYICQFIIYLSNKVFI